MTYGVRSRRCSIRERLSWSQYLILQAAYYVDYLPFRVQVQSNLPFGVWRSLVARGYLRHHMWGWTITPEGRAVITGGHVIVQKSIPKQKTDRVMREAPRYRITRTLQGWAVVDRKKPANRPHNNIIGTFKSRTNARLKARELNLIEANKGAGYEPDRVSSAAE